MREEVACALRIAAPTAAARLATAVELTGRLQRTVETLRGGRITLPMARRLAEEVAPLDDVAAARVQRRVLPRASTQTFSQFAASVRRAVLAADFRRAEEQAAAARAERRVTRRAGAPGMTDIFAAVPAEDGALIWDRLARAAGCGHCPACIADPRTADQRRADAFIALLTGDSSDCAWGCGSGCGCGTSCSSAADGSAGGCPGHRRSERGRRSADAGETRRDRRCTSPWRCPPCSVSTNEPGELAGHGPIPAALARAIAADPTGTWRRLVTDAYGQLLDYGRTIYEPPANLADHVRARDGSCRFPICNRHAENCELDHRIAFAAGGETSEANLHPLCPRHHHLKHEAGWRVIRERDDSTTWISPTGHVYTTPPPDHPAARHHRRRHRDGGTADDAPAAPNAPPGNAPNPPF